MQKIEGELKLLESLDFLNVERLDNNIVEINFKNPEKIQIFFYLNFNLNLNLQKERISLGKIISKKYPLKKINQFVELFVNNFQWKETVTFKQFFQKYFYFNIYNDKIV
jgi:hypothetical protein